MTLGDAQIPGMAQDQKDVQDPERHRRNREEVDGRDLAGMIVQEGPPRLRGRLRLANHVFGHCRVRDSMAQQNQLGQNPRGAPAAQWQ